MPASEPGVVTAAASQQAPKWSPARALGLSAASASVPFARANTKFSLPAPAPLSNCVDTSADDRSESKYVVLAPLIPLHGTLDVVIAEADPRCYGLSTNSSGRQQTAAPLRKYYVALCCVSEACQVGVQRASGLARCLRRGPRERRPVRVDERCVAVTTRLHWKSRRTGC